MSPLPFPVWENMCYEVEDICAARDQLIENRAKIIGDGEPNCDDSDLDH